MLKIENCEVVGWEHGMRNPKNSWEKSDKMNELYHYGVKGMKWGVRKDRRYTDKEISEYRKRKIAEAPTKSESPRGG